MSSLNAHSAEELGHQAIVHDFELTRIAKAVETILMESRQYIVKTGDEVRHIEWAMWVYIGQNILNVQNLVGQVVRYERGHIFLQSGTSFPAPAANDERYALTA